MSPFDRSQVDNHERENYQRQFAAKVQSVKKGSAPVGSGPTPNGQGCLAGAGRIGGIVVVIFIVKVLILGMRFGSDSSPRTPTFQPIQMPRIEIPEFKPIEIPKIEMPDFGPGNQEEWRKLLKDLEEEQRRRDQILKKKPGDEGNIDLEELERALKRLEEQAQPKPDNAPLPPDKRRE
jgi:hypothetical protein